jgi:hypothetical protein
MRELSARCLPRVRRNISNALLVQFWRRLFTLDVTWIHHYRPEIKTVDCKGEPGLKKNLFFRLKGK